MKTLWACAALPALLGLVGCNRIGGPAQPVAPPAPVTFDAASFPPLPPPRPVAPGIVVHEAMVGSAQIWVYLPANAAAPASLPCVFVAPAGTPLVWGMNMEDGDRDEQLPYAQAGFAVVGYSIAGAVPDKPTGAQILAGARLFMDAEAGLTDVHRAIAFTLAAYRRLTRNASTRPAIAQRAPCRCSSRRTSRRWRPVWLTPPVPTCAAVRAATA